MNSRTHRFVITGPAGAIECAQDDPAGPARGVAVLCHPHPVFGGTMDNKVVQTLARTWLQLGWRTLRFNFRGVGGSEGVFDEGRGELDDVLAVIAARGTPDLPWMLAGFSFGGFIAASAAARLPEAERPARLVLIAPSTKLQQVPPVAADTIVIHGESDDTVPLSATLDWAKPQSLPVIVLPGVGHFFHGQLSWLKDVLMRQLHLPVPAGEARL